MDSVLFSEVLAYLESHGFGLLGSKGKERIFRKGTTFIRVEVNIRLVSRVDFETIQAIVDEQEGGFGRLGRRS